jgi:hypothetical protein
MRSEALHQRVDHIGRDSRETLLLLWPGSFSRHGSLFVFAEVLGVLIGQYL